MLAIHWVLTLKNRSFMQSDVGPGLTGRKVGDVAYAGHPLGSYTEEQILHASDVGPGLTGRKVGDVAYAGHPLGYYTEEQILHASAVVPVPPSIDPIVTASIMLKVEPGHTVLVLAAAGGVASLASGQVP